ncbi:hypothetical protein EDB92DRAFT_1821725 [Lactarius akahatsu]|uniref:Uncharacterized protein n=1 Tax=Lactarius akahatsu TaxID=416441 RepID=A0AAD4Q7T2_9AGAM|nr:hypothetical protein EDB92DRAFT_1821725 [Lactarius akahatsu]
MWHRRWGPCGAGAGGAALTWRWQPYRDGTGAVGSRWALSVSCHNGINGGCVEGVAGVEVVVAVSRRQGVAAMLRLQCRETAATVCTQGGGEEAEVEERGVRKRTKEWIDIKNKIMKISGKVDLPKCQGVLCQL